MSKRHREIFTFSEDGIAKEMGTTIEMVAMACNYLHRVGLIDYRPPTSLLGGLSQARLPVQDWKTFYRRGILDE